MVTFDSTAANVLSYPTSDADLPVIKTLTEAVNSLNAILSQDDVTDVMYNRKDRIYIDQSSHVVRAPFVFESNALVNELAEYLVNLAGKSEILKHHFSVDGMLPNGNRLNVIVAPAAMDCTSISIRKFPDQVYSLEKLQQSGMMTDQMAEFLKAAVKYRANIIVSGNTSSGKTTLLNALSTHIHQGDRVVTIEDTAELKIQQENLVRLEIDVLSGHMHKSQTATARELLKSSLRCRPDRIIMGEVRGAEAFDLIQAINTGHKGSMATMHANTPHETLMRLEHMVNMANGELPPLLIKQQIASSVNLVVQTYRNHEGKRRITHITEIIGMEGSVITAHDHFTHRRLADGTVGHYWARANSRNSAISAAVKASNVVH